MPFLSIYILKRKQKIILSRKEQDSFLTHHSKKFLHSLLERASAFISQGSLTVEASLAICFFFCAVLSVTYLMEMVSVQLEVRNALYSVGYELAEEVSWNPIVTPQMVKGKLQKAIGAERLDNSSIVGGRNGLDCRNSKMLGTTTIMELSVQYQQEIPILLFQIPILSREETIRVKGWTGREEMGLMLDGEEAVYITDYGIVYHESIRCSYLELSLKLVDASHLSQLRNQSGETYKACERCGGRGEQVYITDHGNRYHSTLECGGLNRNIQVVKLSELYGKGGCSKCVK